MTYIKFKNISKEYKNKDITIKALKKIDIDIKDGEFVVVTGKANSGKSTLLNLIGGFDFPDDGEILVDDIDVSNLTQKKLTDYRKQYIGFTFGGDDLIEDLTVLENIELVCKMTSNYKEPSPILKKFSLSKKIDFYPSELSESERIKVSLARAICKNPRIILCDEIIFKVDDKSKKQILKALQSLSKKEKTIVILSTQETKILPIANKVISLSDGKLENVKTSKKPKLAGDIKW